MELEDILVVLLFLLVHILIANMNNQRLIEEIKKLYNKNQIIYGFFNGVDFTDENGKTYASSLIIKTTNEPGNAILVPKEEKYLCIAASSNYIKREQILTNRRLKLTQPEEEEGNLKILFYIEEEGVYNFYVGGHIKKPIKIYTLTTDCINIRGFICNKGKKYTASISYSKNVSGTITDYLINLNSSTSTSLFSLNRNPYINEDKFKYYGDNIWKTPYITYVANSSPFHNLISTTGDPGLAPVNEEPCTDRTRTRTYNSSEPSLVTGTGTEVGFFSWFGDPGYCSSYYNNKTRNFSGSAKQYIFDKDFNTTLTGTCSDNSFNEQTQQLSNYNDNLIEENRTISYSLSNYINQSTITSNSITDSKIIYQKSLFPELSQDDYNFSISGEMLIQTINDYEITVNMNSQYIGVEDYDINNIVNDSYSLIDLNSIKLKNKNTESNLNSGVFFNLVGGWLNTINENSTNLTIEFDLNYFNKRFIDISISQLNNKEVYVARKINDDSHYLGLGTVSSVVETTINNGIFTYVKVTININLDSVKIVDFVSFSTSQGLCFIKDDSYTSFLCSFNFNNTSNSNTYGEIPSWKYITTNPSSSYVNSSIGFLELNSLYSSQLIMNTNGNSHFNDCRENSLRFLNLVNNSFYVPELNYNVKTNNITTNVEEWKIVNQNVIRSDKLIKAKTFKLKENCKILALNYYPG